MKILAIDVGGTHVKIRVSDNEEVRKIPSGPKMTARQMVSQVRRLAKDWKYDRVSIGYPGPVARGRIVVNPRNLGAGWVGFDFAKAFGKPVKILNDAAMQALGSFRGGKMLFLGLGTGLGTAVVDRGVIEPMEIAHLQYKKGTTFEDWLGLRGLERLGKKKWRQAVADVVAELSAALEVDYVVLGGGNAKKLKQLPPRARAGDNANAFIGGFRLWSKLTGGRVEKRPKPRPQAQRKPQTQRRPQSQAQAQRKPRPKPPLKPELKPQPEAQPAQPPQ
jgi:polyphosphate glucokinase